MLTFILIGSVVLFIIAFYTYGRFLNKRFDVDDNRPTPSHTDYDGVDRAPAHRFVLFGHHFSSIAGAGPIIGPIIASIAFGWVPTLLWIVIGSIFIGGVQDFSALAASIRNRARSIAEIARTSMSSLAFKLMLVFILLALIYVLAVFIDLTAITFVNTGGVASSSIFFVLLAVGLGIFLYRLKISLLWSSLVFVPLVFLGVWIGQLVPLNASFIEKLTGYDARHTWHIILVIYCFIASITPVWILLQPRDYLSSYLLYASILGAFLGILFGGFIVQYPAFTGWTDPKLGSLFPMLFIIVACGACSGFHSLVASGTTSKQLDKESEIRPVGYGAMLMEAVVAVIALATVAILSKESPMISKNPLAIYASSLARFLQVFKIPSTVGFSLGLLAVSVFILTTLDTATRLSRYIIEEFLNLKGKHFRYLSTAAVLVLPTLLVMITLKDANGNAIPAWKAIWPIFGATNQLLAGLVLLVIAVWLKTTGKKAGFILWPMAFMIVMTVWSLIQLVSHYGLSLIGIIAIILLMLAALLIIEAVRTLIKFREKGLLVR